MTTIHLDQLSLVPILAILGVVSPGGINAASAQQNEVSQQKLQTADTSPDIAKIHLSDDSGATCPLDDIVSKAGEQVEEFHNNLDNVSATEVIQHYTITRSGNLRSPEKKTVDYLASARRSSDGLPFFEEYRGRTHNTVPEFSDGVAVQGAFGLIFIFHPRYVHNFTIQCEGLATWRGQDVWQVSFEERPDSPVRLAALSTGEKLYYFKLQGRALILADTYNVVQLETDVTEPVPEIDLRARHEINEYSPVQFADRNVLVWLPATSDLYMDFRGHRFRQLTKYSDFALFSIKVDQTFGDIR